MKTSIESYYLIPKNGGFQVMRVVLEDNKVHKIEPVSDPDAWEQALSILEHELSKKFQ